MQLEITDITHNQAIPPRFAFARQDANTHVRLADNRNPAIEWHDVPATARSLVLICVDVDAPTDPTDANQEGKEIAADLPRADFYHWVMVDIPAHDGHIQEGEICDGVTARGKRDPQGPEGSRQGLNNYTDWFAGDADMEGQYFGYDGPCPPWNDARVHHYHFKLLATDLAHCPVEGAFGGADVIAVLDGHIVEQAEVVGSYTLNPRLA